MSPHLLLLLISSSLLLVSCVAVNQNETKPGCQPKCGNVNIPYPFGIGSNCSIAPWANVNCNTTFHPPKPFIFYLEVTEFSLNEVCIKKTIATICFNRSGGEILQVSSSISLDNTPYTISTKNRLTAIGCDTNAITIFGKSYLLFGGTSVSGCASYCNKKEDVVEGICSGTGCCQSSIPSGMKYSITSGASIYNHTKIWSFNKCSSVFLVEKDEYNFKVSDLANTSSLKDVPVMINFAIENQTCKAAERNPTNFACKKNSYCYDLEDGGYLCNCSKGYEGNPYLNRGCQDVNECDNNPCEGICTNTKGSYQCSCPEDAYGDGTKDGSGCTMKNKEVPVIQLTLGLGFGLLFLLVGGLWLYLIILKRKQFKLREKLFEKNGGLLLKQQLLTHEGGVESTKIFTEEELKLATVNYDRHWIIGQGGSGTVYKGILPDLRTVAIKKSKLIDNSQVAHFINEVVILTQINHRNVVKLIGCCLETEVPLLVYEFVSNGTLYHHLHKKTGALPFLSWQERLCIAAETAGALAYLHSAASIPIIHRDVKSANILLDDSYTAKVADFGASRLNPLDQTQISTLVQGTMGYLDPEYFHTSQLTEKSDVYSFGVVLAELLTGEVPLCFERSEQHRNLATYFIQTMNENNLFQLLDDGIVKDGKMEEVLAVAELAKRCLYVIGERRPSMKEVAAELEALRGFQKHSSILQTNEEK